jgi:hypothetical protein
MQYIILSKVSLGYARQGWPRLGCLMYSGGPFL